MAHHVYTSEPSDNFTVGFFDMPLHWRTRVQRGDLVEARFRFDHFPRKDGDVQYMRTAVRVTDGNRKRVTGTVERNEFDKQSELLTEWTWRCAACDFDLCDACHGRIPHDHPLRRTRVPPDTWAYCNGDTCVPLKNGTTVSVKRSALSHIWPSESKNGHRMLRDAEK